MIRIISGYGDMGGSTVAFINLVNLLNENGHEAIFYAPHAWMLDQCESEQIAGTFSPDYFDTHRQSQLVLRDYNVLNQILEDDDILICHLLPLYKEHYSTFELSDLDTSKLKKVIYSCHETDVYSVSNINAEKFDCIQYVSEFQRDWHDYNKVPNVVLPNILSPIEKREKTLEFEKIGGVIGTISEAKQPHLAIQAALGDGCDKVLVFGSTDKYSEHYWNQHMAPLLRDGMVHYLGRCDNKALMYSDLDAVYHSSQMETFNYIEKECAMLDIPYVHTDSTEKVEPTELVSEGEILKMWEDVFESRCNRVDQYRK